MVWGISGRAVVGRTVLMRVNPTRQILCHRWLGLNGKSFGLWMTAPLPMPPTGEIWNEAGLIPSELMASLGRAN